MTDSKAERIYEAIREVQDSRDETTLITTLLEGALNWPLSEDDEENLDLSNFTYDYDDYLQEMDFNNNDGPVELRQIFPFPNWPLGIFIVKFGSNRCLTQNRGMTTPLRTILRELMDKHRPTSGHPSWSKEHLLFLCHNETEYFQFARFEDPKGNSKLSKLQMFGWGPNDDIRTLCEHNLKHLIYEENLTDGLGSLTGELVAAKIASAFDISKVSYLFYSDYKKEFERAKITIKENTLIEEEGDLHNATQTIFNRMLFLRFIEKKGWLKLTNSEDEDYLKQLYRMGGIGSSDFYSSRLRPMFFKGLAVKGKQKDDAYGTVPYLNGGLFEETELDKKIPSLPDDFFKPLIGNRGLFYRYNFTVQESTPLDINVAIDPEMIGTMFEQLVTDRDEKGAFYTPRNVVSYMCREAIKSLIEDKTDIDSEKIRILVDDNEDPNFSLIEAKKINTALFELKAIDPACGSGAYLLGLLYELVRIHGILSTTHDDLKISVFKLKRQIIANSIYGVDIDPFATNIAMLRLWLSLSVEAPEPVPLPNLDFKIRTGDSILAPNPSQPNSRLDVTGALEKARQLEKLAMEKYVRSSGENTRKLRTKINEGFAEARKSLRGEEEEIGSVDFGVEFIGVFDNGGFDIVLTNPPYVRQEDIGKSFKRKILTNYTSEEDPPVEGKSDLYCYFYARANQLLRPGGIQVFICSNSWLDVGFGKTLQNYLLKNSHVIRIVDSRKDRQFASADVNTIISFIRNAKPTDKDEIDFMMLNDSFASSINDEDLRTSESINQMELHQRGKDNKGKYVGQRLSVYHRAPKIYHQIMEKLSEDTRSLGNICEVKRGPVTGSNTFFFLNHDELRDIESEYLFDVLRKPAECRSLLTSDSNRTVMMFSSNLEKTSMEKTNALEYIKQGEEDGIDQGSTCKARKNWYTLSLRSVAPILWMEIMGSSHRVFLNDEEVHHSDKFYGIKPLPEQEIDIQKLCIWLNSSPIILHKLLTSFNSLGLGALKTPVYEVESIPIPDLSSLEFDEDALKSFFTRPIKDVAEEMTMADRAKLEEPILSMLGLNNEQQQNLRQEIISFITDRTEKANS